MNMNPADNIPGGSRGGGLSPMTGFLGVSSLFAAVFSGRSDAVKVILVGTLIELVRRFCQWAWERMAFGWSVSAKFNRGDPAYEWISRSLVQRELWRQTRNFTVSAKTSHLLKTARPSEGPQLAGPADFAPIYDIPHLFRWSGYWVEMKKVQDGGRNTIDVYGGTVQQDSIQLTIFTRDVNVLSKFVEDAHSRFADSNVSRVLIRTPDVNFRGGGRHSWIHVKSKLRRPLDSLILEPGVIESLLSDMQDFLSMDNWYAEAGIPHRRGYLLFGPPGTGKTSTVHAIAGELGLTIYAVSLASNSMDDAYLLHVTSQVPSRSILLIEDIDCAFPSRDESEENTINSVVSAAVQQVASRRAPVTKTPVTLSGLLNAIDGIESEEGRLFFATTNHIDRLDSALLRPGRIDKKIEYKLASKVQACNLFMRFFPQSRFGEKSETEVSTEKPTDEPESLAFNVPELASQFSDAIPEHELSTAELQGYLLGYKTDPGAAVAEANDWAEQEIAQKSARKERAATQRKKSEVKPVQSNDL